MVKSGNDYRLCIKKLLYPVSHQVIDGLHIHLPHQCFLHTVYYREFLCPLYQFSSAFCQLFFKFGYAECVFDHNNYELLKMGLVRYSEKVITVFNGAEQVLPVCKIPF